MTRPPLCYCNTNNKLLQEQKVKIFMQPYNKETLTPFLKTSKLPSEPECDLFSYIQWHFSKCYLKHKNGSVIQPRLRYR